MALRERMLLHTMREAQAANVGAVELCASPLVNDPQWGTTDTPTKIVRSEQVQGDLGASKADAAARAQEDHDAALLPTADGGYTACAGALPRQLV